MMDKGRGELPETTRRLLVADLGRTGYGECWDLQKRLWTLRAAGAAPDMLLFTEHGHVYTIGTTGDDNHLLAGAEELRTRGAEVVHTDRGGDITYHGPGQLVGYPILDLHAHYLDLHRYLRDVEEVVIRALERFGITAARHPEYTGVWVAGEKICAIGIRASRWITMHGFALNVATDLSFFDRIIPCGIFERGVTSVCAVLGRRVTVEEILPAVAQSFAEVFGCVPHDVAPERIRRMAAGSALEPAPQS
jgi:lipoate-protein ligase B